MSVPLTDLEERISGRRPRHRVSRAATQERESAVLSRVRRGMEDGGICYKTSGGGEPDLICCRAGRTVVIETKQQGKVPTKQQMIRLRAWARRGAVALWTDDGRNMRTVTATEEIPE